MAPRIVFVGLFVTVVTLLGCGTERSAPPLEAARELLFQKEFDEALVKCDQFLDTTPDSLEGWLLRGEIHQKWGKMDEALADYTKAIAVEPDNPEGYYYRGKLYGYLGDTDQQIADEQRARELDVESRLAYSIDFTPTMPRSMAPDRDGEDPADEEMGKDDSQEDPVADRGTTPMNPADEFEQAFDQTVSAPSAKPRRPADGGVKRPSPASTDPSEADTPYKRWLAQKEAKRRQVEELDLQGAPEAPPEEDPDTGPDRDDSDEPGSLEDEDPLEPSPGRTRFGLQFGGQLPGGAGGQREIATGIRSEDPVAGRGRFFLQGNGRIDGGDAARQSRVPMTGISSRPSGRAAIDGTRGGWMRLPQSTPGQTGQMGPQRQPAGTTAGVWPPHGAAAGPTGAVPGATPPAAGPANRARPDSPIWPLTALPRGSTPAPGSTWGAIPPATTGIRGNR